MKWAWKYAMFNSEGVTIEWQDKQGETQETKLSWARAAGVVQRLVDEGRYLGNPCCQSAGAGNR